MTAAAHNLATPRLYLRPAAADDLAFLLALRDPAAAPAAHAARRSG
ncbi:MAG TPA: hypothetical protein VI504_15460 [Candidatus Eisenbacteria bacterium]